MLFFNKFIKVQNFRHAAFLAALSVLANSQARARFAKCPARLEKPAGEKKPGRKAPVVVFC